MLTIVDILTNYELKQVLLYYQRYEVVTVYRYESEYCIYNDLAEAGFLTRSKSQAVMTIEGYQYRLSELGKSALKTLQKEYAGNVEDTA